MNALLIQGGRVIDPSQGLDAVRDVLVRDGKIFAIGEHLDGGTATLIDARGQIVAPGFIDMHVHLREPGQTHKETIASGSAAAVAGGFTAVCAMPNTTPAMDSPATLAEVARLASAAGLARIYPVAAITKDRAGVELAPYHLLSDAGAVAFSDDGNTVENPRVLRQAALYARDLDQPFISHCEDAQLKGSAVMNEGFSSAKLGLEGSPNVAEEIVVARDLLIAADTKKPWHIAHLSTATGLDLMRWARARGAAVTCEVTPHHLLVHDDLFDDYRAEGKVNPPLRDTSDSSALRAGVRDGSIDVFATDHAPHGIDEKAQLLSAAPVGFTGLEIALGAYAHALPDLPLDRFIACFSTNPARILHLPGGSLRLGAPADITIFGERPWIVDAKSFHSKGKNTPFDGWSFARRAIVTIVDGHIVYQNGEILTTRRAVPA